MARQTPPVIPLSPEWEVIRGKLLLRRSRLEKLRVFLLALFWVLSANGLLLLLVRYHNPAAAKDAGAANGVFILSPGSLNQKDYAEFVKWLDFNDPRKFYGVGYPQNYGNYWRPSANRTELSEPYHVGSDSVKNQSPANFRPLRMLQVNPQLAAGETAPTAKTVNVPALLIYDQSDRLLYRGEAAGGPLIYEPTVLKKQQLRLSVLKSCGDTARDQQALRQVAAASFADGTLTIYWYESKEVQP